jgi:hypothetical protein
MLGRSQQRGKAGVGIESREAKPVHGAVPRDKGTAQHVADKSVIFDELAHAATPGMPADRHSIIHEHQVGSSRHIAVMLNLRDETHLDARQITGHF